MNYFGWKGWMGKMKIIEDERLKLQNLKNIRIAYLIQTTGIIGLLVYDFVKKGYDGMTENPLWYVLILTTVVYLYLSMGISVDHESEKRSPKKGLSISLIVLFLTSVIITILIALTDGFNFIDGTIFGSILFICGLVPAIYIYRLRKRKLDDLED